MQFILTGFTHDSGFRVFSFERAETGQPRSAHIVRVDLALIRRYEIHVQELPLLCRSLLERMSAPAGPVTTFSEDQMRQHADGRDTARRAAADKRKAPKRPASPNAGAAWRTTHL